MTEENFVKAADMKFGSVAFTLDKEESDMVEFLKGKFNTKSRVQVFKECLTRMYVTLKV